MPLSLVGNDRKQVNEWEEKAEKLIVGEIASTDYILAEMEDLVTHVCRQLYDDYIRQSSDSPDPNLELMILVTRVFVRLFHLDIITAHIQRAFMGPDNLMPRVVLHVSSKGVVKWHNKIPSLR